MYVSKKPLIPCYLSHILSMEDPREYGMKRVICLANFMILQMFICILYCNCPVYLDFPAEFGSV